MKKLLRFIMRNKLIVLLVAVVVAFFKVPSVNSFVNEKVFRKKMVVDKDGKPVLAANGMKQYA